MDTRLLHALALCETDVDGALRRFSGDEALYVSCLKAFLLDPTLGELDDAIASQSWDDAFTAAHALKGLAGNLGFVPLFHATGELVIHIRAGRLKEVGISNNHVKHCYGDITAAIRYNCEAPAQG